MQAIININQLFFLNQSSSFDSTSKYQLSGMNLSNRYDYSFKIIVIGDTGVGKSSIIGRFVYNNFNPHHQFTIGVEFESKNIAINGKTIKLQIWDTAGQEEFKAITRSYYRSSAAALIVFDLTRPQTFRNASRWVQDVKNNSNKDVILVLVGNKSDCSSNRMVSRNDALKLARDYQMLYIETSAKSQQNVQRAFIWPATTILDKVEGGFISLNRDDQAIKINDQNRERKQDKQCQC